MAKPPKGFIEIFRGGPQTDSAGTRVDGDQIIDNILSKFAKDGTEAKLVIGHPNDDAPGFGKIVDLKEYTRDGRRVLIAKVAETIASFADQVRKNWFPGRSIAVDSDGTLLHLGFLPKGVPEAVKGMLPAEFQQAGRTFFFGEFEQDEDDLFAKFTNWLSVHYRKEQLAILPKRKTKGVDMAGDKDPKDPDTFSQAELDAATAAAAKKAKDEAKEEAKLEFEQKAAKDAKKTSDKAVETWVTDKVKTGGITPALVDGGLTQFMQGLDITEKHEFAEGEVRTPLEFMKELIEYYAEKTGKVETDELANDFNAAPKKGVKEDTGAVTTAALAFQGEEAGKGRKIGIAQAVTAVRKIAAAGGA